MKNNTKKLIPKQRKTDSQLKSVDDAWNKMAALLDSEMPFAKSQDKKRVFGISISQFAISVVAAMVFVGGGTFITIKTIENKKENYLTKHSYKNLQPDKLDNKTLPFKDSVIEDEPDVQSNINLDQMANNEEVLNQKQSNSQTTLPATTTKTNFPQRLVSGKEPDLNNLSYAENSPVEVSENISKQIVTNFIDTINSQYEPLNSGLSENNNSNNELLAIKDNTKDSIDLTSNSAKNKSAVIDKKKKRNIENNNILFIGLSGYNSLLFSKNLSKNIYSYGEMLTVGIKNTKYNLVVETGIGFNSIEYLVPYSRILYTYQGTGIYDSTITVSSYKYSRYNITIPLYFTKEVLHYNNIFLDIKTGINTSIFISNQRLFTQIPADIQLVEDLYAINKLNISFALSPQFRWEINKKLSFNMNLGGIFHLNSLFQNYTLKPIGLNLSAGLYYSF